MKVKAYAKINLALKVIGKREDGFHNLEMIMVNVNVYDVLKFRKSKNVFVNVDKPICKMEDNIVYKAVMLIKEKYNISDGIRIDISKRIPDGGGMGGGSSDAACTIKSLNEIWNLGMSKEDMFELAGKLGSDVFFFIENKLSFVRGRGELIESINKNFNKDVILIFPDMKCSTKHIFANHEMISSSGEINKLYNEIDNEQYYKFLFNDLEKTVCDLYPDYVLINFKQEIEKVFDCKVLMSGSGSSFFVLGKDIKKIYKYAKKNYKTIRIIKNKTISSCKSNVK